MKKVFLLGLLSGMAMLVISMALMPVFNLVFPYLQSQYENPSLFRSWSDPLMSLYFLYPFISGIILAWIWNKTKNLFKTGSTFKKGINLGALYWFFSLPGILISYSTFQVSMAMTLTWAVDGLLEALIAGIIIAKLNK